MKINNLFFIVVLTVLCLSLGAVSATDSDDVTSVGANDIISVQDVGAEIIEDSVDSAKLANTDDSDDVNIKSSQSLSTSGVYNVNDTNWDDIFTTDKKLNVADYSTINFTSDVYRNNSKIYTIDKAVTINGNGFTLNLDTISGSYFGNETGSAFTINTNGSGTTVNNLKFYNTQVFVRNASNVILDNINVTVENQRIGSGVGVTSIRDYSHNVTVRNSYFRTENNDGSSTLVLAGADNCVLDNNVIIGEGNVGNLLYLTTYNIVGVSVDDTILNSYNNITNNQITGPSASVLCYGITLTGHNNLVENNTINYAGQAITTQWGYTDPSNMSVGNNSEAYTGNNIIANTVNNGGSVTVSKANTVEYNYFTGNVVANANSTINYNTILGTLTLKGNNSVEYNNITYVTIPKKSCNNSVRYNYIESVTLNSGADYNNVTYNTIVDELTDNSGRSNNLLEPNYEDGENGYINLFGISKLGAQEEDPYYIEITKDNYEDYFNEYGVCTITKAQFVGHNWTFYFKQYLDIDTIYFSRYSSSAVTNVTILSDKNIIWSNLVFHLPLNNFNAYICNFTIDNVFINEGSESPELLESHFLLYYSGNNVNVTFENLNLTMETNSYFTDEHTLSFIGAHANEKYINCYFDITCPVQNIDWDNVGYQYGRAIILRDNSVFVNNTVIFNENGYAGEYATMQCISLLGDNILFSNNNIVLNGSHYLYAIYMEGSSNNNVSDNNFTVRGSKYTSGIYMTGVNYGNNIIANNIINCSSGFGGNTGNEGAIDINNNNAEDSIYPIVIEDRHYNGGIYSESTITVTGNKILNNTIYASGNNGYGIEQFGGNDTTIANNTIIVTGVTPKAIAFTGTNSLINGNTIIVSGSNNEYGTTADYFPAKTNGIYLQASSNVVVSENNIDVVNGSGIATNSYSNLLITDNNISTDQEYAVLLKSTTGTTVSDNILKSKNGVGNEAVYSNDESNVIKDNSAPAGSPSVIIAEDIIAYYGDKKVVAILKDDKGEVLASKNVIVTIGNETYNVTTNDNGEVVIDIANVPGTYNAVVKFDGDENYDASEASINVVVNAIPVNLSVSNLVKYYGDSRKLSIVLKDNNGNVLASKKVTVTINGKTYALTTDKNGKATLAINLAKGSYSALVKFNQTGYQTVSKKVSVKVVTPIINAVKNKVKKGNYFQVSFKTYNKKAIKSTKVTMKLKSKTYTVKTNSKGIAKLKLNVKKGTYKVKVAFKSTVQYGKTTKTLKVKVY